LLTNPSQLFFIYAHHRETPASEALHLSIDVFTGAPAADDWRCTPGNLAPGGGRQHRFIYQCLSVCKSGPPLVEIALTHS